MSLLLWGEFLNVFGDGPIDVTLLPKKNPKNIVL
jgi:hypothetical protein